MRSRRLLNSLLDEIGRISCRRPRDGRARGEHHRGGVAAMIDLTTQTARKIAESVRRRELTAVAVTQAALERIGQLNGTLRAFITVTRDDSPCRGRAG